MTTNMRETLQMTHEKYDYRSLETRCDSSCTTMMNLPNIARKKSSSISIKNVNGWTYQLNNTLMTIRFKDTFIP
jgi:hypothetical protein